MFKCFHICLRIMQIATPKPILDELTVPTFGFNCNESQPPNLAHLSR